MLFESVDLIEYGAGNDAVAFTAAWAKIPQPPDDAFVAGAEHFAQDTDHPLAHRAEFIRKSFPQASFHIRFGAHNLRPSGLGGKGVTIPTIRIL